MEVLKFDLNQEGKPFKVLNATNGGPWHWRHTLGQYRSNLEAYKKLRIPYSRNHDSGDQEIYGAPYSHDINKIFPNFDLDPYDPESYDFLATDESIEICCEAGTKTFFRLGQTIENMIRQKSSAPPKDFKKWAVICEHIVRHYNEGWADGYHMDIEYWEIWNEPDLCENDPVFHPTWAGTRAQFFDLFEITAKHLKSYFPNIKVGGPALAYREDWCDDFLAQMKERGVKIDFFSWHMYGREPADLIARGDRLHALLDKHGYKVESVLDEWNYLHNWGMEFQYSVNAYIGMKGASFMSAFMGEAQYSSIDMIMYYDTRPSVFNGVFDFYTCEPLKGYYPMYWCGMFYDCQHDVPITQKPERIYGLCGVNEGKILATLTYYAYEEDLPSKTVKVDFGREGTYEIYLLDDKHDGTLWKTTSDLTFDMPLYTTLLIKEI